MWRVFLFCTFVLFAQGTLPTLTNSTVKIKDLSLLGTELSLATYTFTFDQELYLHKANFCPVYNCTADALTHIDQPACVCDYATKSSCGTGYLLNTSTPCSCDISLCDTNVNPWTEVALGGAQTFRMELAEGETRHWRVFVNTTCTGFRAHVTSFAGTSSLRISNKDIATLTNSYWKKTNEYEKEEVFICPVDQHFVQGTYFIAVSATTQTVFDFAIEEVLVDQPKVANPSNCGGNLTAFPSIPGTALCVQDGIPVNFNNGQPLPAYYFNVTFTNGKCTPVFVNIQTYTSDAALACSISLPRDAQKVQWKTYDRESFLVCPVGSESWTPMQISLRTNHLWAGPYRFRLSVSTSHFNTSWTHTRLADIAANEVNFDLLGTTTVETNPYPVSQSFQFTTTLITLSDYFFMCTSWKENCKGLSFSTNSNPLYPVPPIVWNLPGVGDQFRTIQGNYSLPSTPNDPKSYSAVVVLSYRTNTYVVNIPESGVEVISINFHGKVGSLDGDVLYGNHTATLIKPSCEYEEFQNDLQEINQILDDLSGTSDATAIDTLRYKLDSAAYQDGFTFCREYVDNLTVGVSSQNFTIASYFCPYVFGTAEWVASACCNQGAIWRASCVPSNLTGPLPKFEVQQEAVKSVCKHTECSQSYLEDYSSAKAAFDSGQCSVDPVQQKIRDETTQKQYLACKAQAFPFSGENCVNDQDCHYYYDNTTYACSMSSLTCVVPYELMEEAFIDCLRLLLTEGSEAYLQSKYNIVAGREDPAFTQQWMAAARSPDCVDLFGNSVNLEHRTKHIISAADVLCGNRYSCPSVECEDTSCPFAEQACLASCGMAKLKQDGIESQCVSESVCNWDSNLCDGATLANCTTLCQNPGPSFCGFCDSADECTQFSEISSPAQCASTSVCLLPNGTYFFNLTDSQCDALTKCDLPYCGRQCSASNPTYSSGICFSYEPDSTSCTSKSGQWLNNTGAHTFSNNSNICVFSAQDSATCAGTVGTTWQTCGALSLYSCAQCANGNCNSLTQNLMQCAITGKPCPDATTCANSGICSDSEYYLNMASPQKYGGCTMGRFPAPDIMSFTYCPASAMISVPNKCIWITSLGYDNTSCNHLNVTYFASSWILPAEDQATCLAPKACLELFDQQERFSQKNQANCLAADGDVWTNTWEWRQGRWMGGVKRSLSWTARSASLKYNWTSTLDFSEVQDAFYQAVLQNDVLDSKSASLCQYQRTLVPMEAVTCDCTESGSGDCFETDPLSVIAQARVCSGVNDTEFYSGLRLTTSTDTVDIGCAEILISTISIRNYASVTKERLLANFIPLTERAVPQFPIFNDHGALVGQILTDGVTITPLADASLGSFELCIQLQAAQKQYEASSEFPVFDFATTDAKKQDIIPMKFDAHQIKILQNSVYDGDYLCATVSNITQETTYFAIERKANYEDEQKDLLSPQAEALSFTLAAMFAVTALISSAQIVYYVFNYFFNQLPFILEHVLILFIWMFVSVRTIYFFLLSSGYDSSVGDYALVALPTFFYFTAFSIIVVLWAVVASKRFTNDAAAFKRIINRALIGINMFLYAIFIALVLSFQFAKSTSDSPCSGRQQGEDNSSQIQKSISIAYGLVIAIISMIIGLLFVVFGYRIRTFIAASESHERIFIVTAVCSVSFILHSIFIVVVAFLQSPNLYFSFFGLIVTEWFPAVFIIVWLFIRRSGVKSSSRDSRSLNTKNTLSSGTRVNVKSNSSRSRTDDNTITSDGVELPTYKST